MEKYCNTEPPHRLTQHIRYSALGGLPFGGLPFGASPKVSTIRNIADSIPFW